MVRCRRRIWRAAGSARTIRAHARSAAGYMRTDRRVAVYTRRKKGYSGMRKELN